MTLALGAAFFEVAHAGIAKADDVLGLASAGFYYELLATRLLLHRLVAFELVAQGFNAVLAHFALSRSALAVGAPGDPGFRIRSPEPAAIRSRLA
jgi:hypothetical protein